MSSRNKTMKAGHAGMFFLVAFLLVGTTTVFAQNRTQLSPASGPPSTPERPGAATPQIVKAYGALPLSFEANQGQTDPQVKFLSRGRGYTLFLTRGGEAVLVLHGSNSKRGALRPAALSTAAIAPERDPVGPPAVVRMRLVAEKNHAAGEGLDQLPGQANYFVRNDPKKWQTNVPTYGKVRYREVYPGVDVVYYGNQRQLEHDFVVAPGANPRSIVLNFAGAEKLLLDAQGRLVLRVKETEVRFEKPRVYQDVSGARREISGSYVLKGAHRAGFAVGAYDASTSLVIDPVLVYSTYLGGSGNDGGGAIAVDSAGNAYVTGATSSANFPGASSSAIQSTLAGGQNAFVAKINAAGSALVYSTYLGGGNDGGNAIAVDSASNAYVTGQTESANFPVVNAIQSTNGGYSASFVAKVNAAGSALVYSTYLGGSNTEDEGEGIALDSSGNAYVTGITSSTSFPGASSSTIQPTFSGSIQNAYVIKINAAGSALVYSTYLGGNGASGAPGGGDNGSAIAVDSSGNAYVTGETESTNFPVVNAIQSANGGYWNTFVAKINAAGSALVYSTYLGGSNNYVTAADQGYGIAVDSSGNAYVTGVTLSTNFPGASSSAIQSTLAGSQNAYVAKINAAGSALVYSTYLGGSSPDYGHGIAVDSSGNAYVTGITSSTSFPVVNAIQPTSGGGRDAFVAEVNAAGSALVYSTYLGGSSDDVGSGIAVDSSGNAYVTGATDSTNFPVVNAIQPTNGGNYNAFVAKIGPPPTLTITAGSGTMTYGGSVPAINPSYSGFVNGDTFANLTAQPICTTKATNTSPVGTYPSSCSGAVDSNYTISYAAGSVTVNSASTTTAVRSSANPSILNSSVTLTATVSAAVIEIPTGSVTFKDGATVLATVAINAAGQATFSTSSFAVGSHSITATYSGDSNFSGGASTVLSQLVQYEPAGTLCNGGAGHQILPPINADGSSVYKQGRTVPAKFSVCDANGVSIGTPGVVSSFFLTGVQSGTVTKSVEDVVDTNVPDMAFRWDPTGLQWIFNITTANLTAGSTYMYTITLNDGSTIMFQYGLR